MYTFFVGLIFGFEIGGIIFYNYGKRMALRLHRQYIKSDNLTCDEAIKYEEERSRFTIDKEPFK